MSNDTYLVRKTFLGDVQMKKDELRVSVDGLQCRQSRRLRRLFHADRARRIPLLVDSTNSSSSSSSRAAPGRSFRRRHSRGRVRTFAPRTSAPPRKPQSRTRVVPRLSGLVKKHNTTTVSSLFST